MWRGSGFIIAQLDLVTESEAGLLVFRRDSGSLLHHEHFEPADVEPEDNCDRSHAVWLAFGFVGLGAGPAPRG